MPDQGVPPSWRVDRMPRRTAVRLLGLGAAVVLGGCAAPARGPGTEPAPAPTGPGPDPARVPPADPPRVLSHGPTVGRRIALSVDDGYDDACVAAYAAFAERTGIHLTMSPNGLYGHAWKPQAARLEPLVRRGQVQFINHTFNHPDLVTLPDGQVREELERNEEWVARTFGTETRPYFRPPFGSSNPHVDQLVAGWGWDRIVLWNGSFGDADLVTPQFLLDQARRYLQPGVVMLGHANHPTVIGLLDEIADLIRTRDLTPVTLDEMFGTTRPPSNRH